MATTIKTMQRVEEIKRKRELQFYKNRMKGTKEAEMQDDMKQVQKNVALLNSAPMKIMVKASQKLNAMETEQ
jgi:large subunit ribosomal protein L24e